MRLACRGIAAVFLILLVSQISFATDGTQPDDALGPFDPITGLLKGAPSLVNPIDLGTVSAAGLPVRGKTA